MKFRYVGLFMSVGFVPSFATSAGSGQAKYCRSRIETLTGLRPRN